MSEILLPKEYAYPVAFVVATFWLSFWQSMKVSRARKAAKIEYPQLYAEQAQVSSSHKAKIFNCTQRAHQNTLEYLPQVAIGTLVLGLRHPRIAASVCGVWIVFRVIYTIGYSTGDPWQRNRFFSSVGHTLTYASVMIGATYTTAKMVMEAMQ